MRYRKKYRQAVDWLVEHDFAAHNDDKLVLLTSCIETQTSLRQPKLVELPEEVEANSSFGLRKKLIKSGWTAVEKRAGPSVRDKKFRPQNNVKAYYWLLLMRHLAWLTT